MRRLLFIATLFYVAGSGYCLDIEGRMYTEVAPFLPYNYSSYNPNGLHQMGNFDTYFRGNLICLSGSNRPAFGLVDVQLQGTPISHVPSSGTDLEKDTDQTEILSTREIYASFRTEGMAYLHALVGKRYWDFSTGFFTPLDLYNPPHDVFLNESEADGFNQLVVGAGFRNPKIDFSGALFTELDTDGNNPLDLTELPISARVDLRSRALSSFAYIRFDGSERIALGASARTKFDFGSTELLPYGEIGYRNYTDRKRFNEELDYVAFDESYYLSIMLGADAHFPDLSLPFASRLSANAEYVSIGDNWTHTEFLDYLRYLDDLKANDAKEEHLIAQEFTGNFKNATTYLLTGIDLYDLFAENFHGRVRMFINLDDMSPLLVPELIYRDGDPMLEVGLRLFVPLKRDNAVRSMPDVENRTEFGTTLYSLKAVVYTRINLHTGTRKDEQTGFYSGVVSAKAIGEDEDFIGGSDEGEDLIGGGNGDPDDEDLGDELIGN